MVLDLAIVLALFAFAWLGAHRGGPESAIRLIGLALAYGGSVLAGKVGGGPLAAAVGVAGWMGGVLAGLLGFLALQALVEVAARKARAAHPEPSDASRIAGAACGIARAALLLLPVLFLASFTQSVRAWNPAAPLPDLSGARAAALGQAAASAAAERLTTGGDGASRVTAQFVAQPGESLSALGELASDPRLRVLQADAGFWGDLERGDVESALARPTFDQLARDPDLRGRLAELGLVDATSAADPERFHQEMAAVMAEVGPRLQRIEADPAFQALLADEALRARIQAGDTLALLTDPRLQQILANATR
jgi:hypothetical protein